MIESCNFTRERPPSRFLASWSVLLLALPCALHAQATLNPYASAQVEYDSNVFRVENSQIAEGFYHDPQLSDTDLRYVGGVEGTYMWGGLQKLTATLEGRRIDYDHFTFLNHSEYLANIQLDWKLASVLDGSVQFRQEHLAAYFADSNSPYLEVDTDRNVVAKLNLRFHTDWRLETGANSRNYDAPLQFYPDFNERETGTHLGLSYLGVSFLTYGVGADHIDGNYTHAPGVGPYSQTSEYLRMNYAINGLQTLVGEAGYTKRSQTGEQNVSAATGKLKYTRQLTGKTSVTVQVGRAVNSYVASAGSEIDTTGSLGVKWQATYKLAVELTVAETGSRYVGQIITDQVVPGLTVNGRTDHSPSEVLNVTYQTLRHLQIRAYVNQQSRHSNVAFDRYDDTTVGVQALAHWR